ncbi:D-alanyl-D-alanine carboxypeptidase family protein [Paenibacillus sp. 1001270B_150601_E10]|uniref:D-alanyl-D-alanine carboxypeptidase family protein n=1 Tax=Paenibacillus sp. 1001270B_150601_E10 TaxID=2787079 RepID=UPI002B4BF263|nr:D-alanyl-D-alanine carboxypeptidase family protein [Paenibacillus sp. 1001270B_150601_E10]
MSNKSSTIQHTASTNAIPQKRRARSKVRLLLGVMLISCGILWIMHAMDFPLKTIYAIALDRLHLDSNDHAFAGAEIEAKAAVVMDGETGETIFYKNDQDKLPMASTTKIMTALIALDAMPSETLVRVGSEVEWTAAVESKAGLVEGQLLTWEELIKAMMLPSGNDAARTIAVQVGMQHAQAGATRGEAYQAFVVMMNKKAKQLGMERTHFTNPHGMHDPNHYSTAHDLAALAYEAMQHEGFREIVMEKRAALSESSPDRVHAMTVVNRNKLLQEDSGYYYDGAIGIKTGFTDQAGYCLVSSAERQGQMVIAVVLHSTETEVWTDSHTLLDYGFDWSRAKGRMDKSA